MEASLPTKPPPQCQIRIRCRCRAGGVAGHRRFGGGRVAGDAADLLCWRLAAACWLAAAADGESC